MWIAVIVDPEGFIIEPVQEHRRVAKEAIAFVNDGLFSTHVGPNEWTIAHEHVIWYVAEVLV